MIGVVDSRLKVYGLENVRIVDAGIIPMMITGTISSTVYAVAEKVGSAQHTGYSVLTHLTRRQILSRQIGSCNIIIWSSRTFSGTGNNLDSQSS